MGHSKTTPDEYLYLPGFLVGGYNRTTHRGHKMFIVTLDGVEYQISGYILTDRAIRGAKAQAIGQATAKGQQVTKDTQIIIEWSEKPYVTPDP